MRTFYQAILRAPEGDGGAPAAVAPAAVVPPVAAVVPPTGAPPAAVVPPGGVVPPAAVPKGGYRPADLPDHMYGTTDQETIDKLALANAGFRKKQGDWGEVPKDAKGYEFKPSEVVAPYVAKLGDDPFFAKVTELAHKSSIPAKQFNAFINDIMGEMIVGQMVEEPFNADKERAILAPSITDPAERAIAADRMVRDATARVEIWKGQGLPANVATSLLATMDRAATVQLVEWIGQRGRETGPALGGVQAGAITEGDLKSRVADPRNKVGGPKFEAAFAAETDRMFKAKYPSNAA